MKIQTQAVHFSADAVLLTSVEQKVSKLKTFFNCIKEARIRLMQTDETEQGNRIAEIYLQLPNGVIYSKVSSKTFEVALGKAIVLLKVQLLRFKAKKSK